MTAPRPLLPLPLSPLPPPLPPQGKPLRFSKSLSYEEAGVFATEMAGLVAQARGVVRDVDPRDELHFFRLRGRDREIMCATAEAFLVVVVQRWRPTPVGDGGGGGAGAAVGAAGGAR
jgi:dynein light chain roadblock-type